MIALLVALVVATGVQSARRITQPDLYRRP